MMEEDPLGSDEKLPQGWTVQVRVRKNGKRDKYYFSPTSGLKFNSKVEVFRHLESVQNKVSIQRVAENVVVEKGVAEGLPPGWMKKTRVTTKGDTVRRDSYYIDPVSGYAFRSIKDVDRYLESGEIGRNAFKPKDTDSSDMESKADKFSSVGETTKPTLSVGMGPNLDLDTKANDQRIQKPAGSGECVVAAEGLDPKEGKVGLAGSTLVLGEESQEKQLQESEQTQHGTGKAQGRLRKRNKKEINLPRRTSKRLAGIQLDPVPELKARTRRGRAAAKQSGEGEAIGGGDNHSNSSPNAAAKQNNALQDGSETKCTSDSATNTVELSKSTPEKLPDKTIEEHGSDKDTKSFSFWPQEDHATAKEHVKVRDKIDELEAKFDYNFKVPLREMLKDPCIAFAVQVLTGETFDIPETSKVSAELKDSNHSETAAAAEGYGKKIDKGGSNVFSHPGNFAVPQAHAGGAVQIANKANQNAGSSSEMAPDIWEDPCIEFAIKTLTGSIPLDTDKNPNTCTQQQLGSPNTTGNGDMALPSVSLDNLCQTNYYRGPMFDPPQPPFVDPTPQQARNVGKGSSAGARVPHCGDDRRNAC